MLARHARWTRSGWAATASCCCEGAEALGVSHGRCAATPARCVAVQLVPDRLPTRRQARDARLLPAARGGGRRAGPRGGRGTAGRSSRTARATGVECVAGSPTRRRTRRPFSVRARRGRDRRRRGVRDPGAAAALGLRSPSGELGRNLRIHPGVLGRSALRRGGARLGGRDAELRRRRVGGARAAARGDVHAARVRRPVAARAPASSIRSACWRTPASPRPGSTCPTAPRGGSGSARDGSLRITYRLHREDADRLVFGIARAAELFYAAGATRGLPADRRDSDAPARRGSPSSRPRPRRGARLRLEAFHPIGTARMDADPRRGVTGTDGAVHGAEALYVADGSLLPSSIGVNPMMTIIAMASRVARQAAERRRTELARKQRRPPGGGRRVHLSSEP